MSELRRLNWGCGRSPQSGWINSDRKPGPGVDVPGDIRTGLPLADDSFDTVASVHALEEIPYSDLLPVLRELRRVLKPGGVLRLALPDLDKGIRAYLAGDRDFFLIPDDDARSVGGKFITQLLWYGHSRTLFTSDFVEELLLKAGFSRVAHCAYRQTASADPCVVDVDNRENESLYVEAFK